MSAVVTAWRLIPALLAALLLAACASTPKPAGGSAGAAPEPGDGPSGSGLRAEDVKDAVPRAEPLARYGNHSPYEVFGRKYYVLKSSEGYHERGIASWYGRKFHGRRTSSGEPYDMHLATAAHKTLPLPTFAEVTNLDNGKRVVVKINDRGPFKDDRLIDMSYGAALRLGMIGTGTARVEVRAIDVGKRPPGPPQYDAGAAMAAAATWLQIGAFGRRDNAEDLAGRLRRAGLSPVSVNPGDDLYRVWLGPYGSQAEADAIASRAVELGFERPHRISR